ncbi:UDP-N-acetylglucosamine 1-carboxyvinyltransferase [Sedimentibacter acidaminivorans]|uniref:UDP-N-acetylglucosamine 1-carboxyvinyltransferase n=1 Tax=Sedimentibacter acidaminivorans TaxID=913099 RepID=A0ABS4GHG0_9FIRM|nr:UDP-N-acetylglucosamine 1-carboxyvinyltransferase [Sedimentibacter acidaminivorans]MBP1927047.1 UDP-N-acetylglucosamine 1-carboxyvinyltransferase [Sedimentibacter acidaminivorans]
MSKFVIEGGTKLKGKVNIGGFKNAAVAIIPATILCQGKCIIQNVPRINDVNVLEEILTEIGADVEFLDDMSMSIDATDLHSCYLKNGLSKKIRASYYLLGAGLGRFKKASTLLPGGCAIGERPIDQHIKGFEALGAKVDITPEGRINVQADKLIGNRIYLDVVSVGATINIMLAAIYAEGKTVIENAAKEPHIVDTANFLNSMGADVKGAGTDVIKINGVKELSGCTYRVIPDQIEAGTYMIAAAATKGDIIIDDIIPKHLEPVTAKLKEMGMGIEEYGDSMRIFYERELEPVNIQTLPYPGFPTDLQQPMTVLLSSLNGESIVVEGVSEDRFKYVNEIKKMGANIDFTKKHAKIEGTNKLMGTVVQATDLRAGAALIIAGLVAEGLTEITDIYHIDRGYEHIENKFMNLGAKIRRVKEEI